MLICVSSVRGAPGVSSWALTLAAAWQHSSDRVLVEADCSGGVVTARYDIPAEPGLADLLSASRGGALQVASMDSLAQQLRPSLADEASLWVVPAPLLGHEAHTLWSALVSPAATSMSSDRRLWIADCGRVWPGAPGERLMMTADHNVLVTDTAVESLVVLQSRVRSLPKPPSLLVIGKSRYSESELQAFTGAAYVFKVPYFSSLAQHAAGFARPDRKGYRTRPWRAALEMVEVLSALSRPGAPPIVQQAPPQADAATPPPPSPSAQSPGQPDGPPMPPDEKRISTSDQSPQVQSPSEASESETPGDQPVNGLTTPKTLIHPPMPPAEFAQGASNE